MDSRLQNDNGFSLLELLVIMGLIGVLSGMAVGVTNTVVRMARADSGAQQLDAFLKRTRAIAIARRRDVEIQFIPPNQVSSLARAIPDPPAAVPPPTVIETMTLEGGMVYRLTNGIPDTPNLFGNLAAIAVGGAFPVMFSSDGAFLDAAGNPVNATISLGIEGDPLSATAVTILGSTAGIDRWRWNGGNWTR